MASARVSGATGRRFIEVDTGRALLRSASRERLEEFDNRGGAAGPGVSDQRDAVRAGGEPSGRVCRNDRLDDLQLAEHRGGEQVDAGPARQEVSGDLVTPHVRRGAESRLP